MIDFTTLQGLTIPEGVVTQITDESGRVIWAVANNAPVVLQVEKITSDTYAAETTYTGESFILLDIYPKNASSKVKVTYGGLTKTLTFSGTNAQQVFFGTFNGVTDEVATAASGTLTIEGGCQSFAIGTYKTYNSTSSKTINNFCRCITAVSEWGGITSIADRAFDSCTSLALTSLPSGITSIGTYAFNTCTSLALTSLPSGITSIRNSAFSNCTKLALTSLPNSITSIGDSAFYLCTSLALTSLPSGITSIEYGTFNGCEALTNITIHSGITSIGNYAFLNCTALKSVTFDNPTGWYVTTTKGGDISTGTAVDLSDPANNATLLNSTYSGTYYWYRS